MPKRLPAHDDAAEALFEAQDLMYDAFEADGTRRVELALEALEISRDCADAYLVLALAGIRDAPVHACAGGARRNALAAGAS
jgi:hypothetical protein